MKWMCLVRGLGSWVGLLGLAAGCGSPSVGHGPGGAAEPARREAARSGPVPLHETVPRRPISLDSVASGAVRVARVRLPGEPRYQAPQVQLPDTAAARRINATLTRLLLTDNLENTAQTTTALAALRRARTEYEGTGQTGIFASSYDVLLNRAGLLSLALTTEYSGAYPWAATQHVTFEVATGRLLTLADLLADTLALRQRWHQRINRRLAAHLRQVAKEYPSDSVALDIVREHTYWSDSAHQIPARYRPPLREFALTPQGLVLYTRFWFPHVALALSPDDEYPFAYAQVLPWAGPRSLLHRLPR